MQEKKRQDKLPYTEEFRESVENKREVKINEECIAESVLDIWCPKKNLSPELIQYEIYKCFILKFELAFSGFINPIVDVFHYTLKDIVLCDKINEVTENTIAQYFEAGTWIDKHTSSVFIKLTAFKEDGWYLEY